MNLLFIMSFTMQNYELLGILKPFTIIRTDADTYIANTNRIILFFLGITVSSNIYLYTTRNKISSSIMWTSRQIGMLKFNLVINIGTLILGISLTNYEILYNEPISENVMRYFLRIYLSLNIISLILFISTLVNFIDGFTVDKNISKLTKKINKRIYPKRIDILIREINQIIKYAEDEVIRFNQFNKITNVRYKNTINNLNKNKYVILLKKRAYFLMKYFFILKVYFYLGCTFKENDYIKRTSRFSKREIRRINLEIEILSQNIEYIIKTNSDKSIMEHSKKWNATFSQIIVMIFHIDSSNPQSKDIIELYRTLLHNHSKLITVTSGSYENRKFHKEFIKSILNGLAYREESESVSKQDFFSRTVELEEVYFDELFSLLMNLMSEKNFEIFNLLHNEKLSLNSFMNTKDENEKYYGSRSRKQKFEQLFVSVLINMIELNITENMTSVMAILLSLREENTEIEMDVLPLSNKKNVGKIVEKKSKIEVNLTHENKKGLYYAFIKANELENYKAAGYIVKILSSNIKYDSITKVITEINNEKHTRNITYETGIYSVDFNDYSFEYCVNKSFVLINAQYFYKMNYQLTNELLDIYKQIDFVYLIEKLGSKQKEYNMVSLDKDSLHNFKMHIDKHINDPIINKILITNKKKNPTPS